MSYRHADWNEGLSRDLKNRDFAARFVAQCLKEGIPHDLIISKLAKAYGLVELSKKAKVASPNIVRITRSPKKARWQTIDRILKPFGLTLGIVPRVAGHSKAVPPP